MPENVEQTSGIEWPEGKQFAFTVFDDTDRGTMDNVPVVYEMLQDLGFRTTKSVWPLRGSGTPVCGGDTLEDAPYRKWILQLQDEGFEIGYHMATYHSSPRSDTIRGLDRFKEILGHDPMTMANHVGCQENVYWGAERFRGPTRLLYNLLTRFKHRNISEGHVRNSRYFWADLCRNRVRYVRDYAYRNINSLRACPLMPYHDPTKPFVRAWFSSSQGSTVQAFNHTIRECAQDRLEEMGGACIMYAHFGFQFSRDGSVNPEFQRLMKRLSTKNGWFVPAATLLEFLEQRNGLPSLTHRQRQLLALRWLASKTLSGTA